MYVFDSSTILAPLVPVCIIQPVSAVADSVVAPIVQEVAVNAPACVTLNVGDAVGHDTIASAPLGLNFTVFDPVVTMMDHAVMDPMFALIADRLVTLIFPAVTAPVAISFAVIELATILEASIFCPHCPCITEKVASFVPFCAIATSTFPTHTAVLAVVVV